MGVNNSATRSAQVGISFPGSDVKIFSMDWNGKEYQGPAYSATGGITQTDSELKVKHFLAPGQEFVYRVDSKSAASEPISPK